MLTHAGSAGDAPPYSDELIDDIVNAGRPVVGHRGASLVDLSRDDRVPGSASRIRSSRRTSRRTSGRRFSDSFKNWHTAPYFSAPTGRCSSGNGGSSSSSSRARSWAWARIRDADELPHRGALA